MFNQQKLIISLPSVCRSLFSRNKHANCLLISKPLITIEGGHSERPMRPVELPTRARVVTMRRMEAVSSATLIGDDFLDKVRDVGGGLFRIVFGQHVTFVSADRFSRHKSEHPVKATSPIHRHQYHRQRRRNNNNNNNITFIGFMIWRQ